MPRSLAHLLDDRGQGERSSAREAVEDDAQAEPVVAVAVGDVNRRQVSVVGGDPVREAACRAGGQQRGRLARLPFTGDERR